MNIVRRGLMSEVRWLLQSQDWDQETLDMMLHEALVHRHVRVMALLLQHGGNPNAISRRYDGNLDAFFVRPLLECAVMFSMPDAVKCLLLWGAHPNTLSMIVHDVDQVHSRIHEYPPLVTAVEQSDVEIVQLLLDAGADPTRPETFQEGAETVDENTPREMTQDPVLWQMLWMTSS